MATSSDLRRAWQGPAVLSFGFRPFFLGAALWAALAMGLWLAMLAGLVSLPSAFDPVAWHAHEFLYGYLMAVVAGFLLTAVPNWTGRLPMVGWPLGGLALLWLAGRLAVLVSVGLPPLAVALADLALPVVLAAALAREIVAGRNWRNLGVLALLGLLATGNAVFHWEAAQGHAAAQGYGLRIGLAAGVMMIGLIGGRIIPSFTRNWLVRRGPGRLPAPPMQRADKAALLVLALALILWIAAPLQALTGVALLVAGALHLHRLGRWAGERVLAEPLVWVLHAGYAFVPLGALALGVDALVPGLLGPAAQHLWMAGAIGVMTLAVMSRATLGHTGQALHAGRGTTALYLALLLAVLARFVAGVWPGLAGIWLDLAGLGWIVAFAGFGLLYGPLLLRARG